MPLVFFFPKLMKRSGIDDRLDAFAIHGIGGMVGSAFVGLFADTPKLYPSGTFVGLETPDVVGSFFGFPRQLGIQCAGISVSILYSLVGTTIIFWILWALATACGASMAIPVEFHGNADVSQHGEKAYHAALAPHASVTATAADALALRGVAPQPAVAAVATDKDKVVTAV